MKTITFETIIEKGTIPLPADYKFEGEVKHTTQLSIF